MYVNQFWVIRNKNQDFSANWFLKFVFSLFNRWYKVTWLLRARLRSPLLLESRWKKKTLLIQYVVILCICSTIYAKNTKYTAKRKDSSVSSQLYGVSVSLGGAYDTLCLSLPDGHLGRLMVSYCHAGAVHRWDSGNNPSIFSSIQFGGSGWNDGVEEGYSADL